MCLLDKAKVILAYSGGLDTSVILKWLQQTYDYDVIAMAADVGQGEEELAGLEEKALATGAAGVFIEDVKEELVTDYIFPMLCSGAVYEGKYLLGTAIARPVIAKRMVRLAERTGATALAHGATGKGNDQVRFELAVNALNPDLEVIAPWREWDITSRSETFAYARRHSIPVPVTVEKPYSIDSNIWHTSYEGGLLEDPWFEPEPEMFRMTRSPREAPDEPELLEVTFEKGLPVSVNGKTLNSVELLAGLNVVGGRHGIGRVDMVENRMVGIKSRGVYETPGGTILAFAHRELEQLTLDRDTYHYKESAALKYAELIYNGLWFTPLREALQAFVEKTQETVSGTVKLKLYKGQITVTGRRSPYSIYHSGTASFEADALFDQKEARGFVKILGLPLRIRGILSKGNKVFGKDGV